MSKCIEWTGERTKAGYGVIEGALAHRVVWTMANGRIPKGMFVCHSCDNKACINLEHLWLGTPSDNVRDMWAKGRGHRHGGGGRGKLTEDQVREMRRLVADGASNYEMCRKFHVTSTTVSHVISRRSWADVTD
jgi:hypothetical protein